MRNGLTDKRRIRRVFGRIDEDDLAALDQGLELLLGRASERRAPG